MRSYGKVVIAVLLSTAASAQAAPVTLVCDGNITFYDDRQSPDIKIDRQTAVLDLEGGTFKPPMYPAYQIKRSSDTDIGFGLENSQTSISGNIDRVSGALSMQKL
jgi:hypothetical protein